MNYIYQDKGTMKPGVAVLMIYNKDKPNKLNNINKDIISKIGHLSIPMGLYEGCKNKKSYHSIPTIQSVSDNSIDLNDVVNNDVYDNLIHKSSKMLPTERKTRKAIQPILKIKTKTIDTAKSKAIQAYLELKEIKNKYMIQEVDEDEENFGELDLEY